jgi:hypothetical protein
MNNTLFFILLLFITGCKPSTSVENPANNSVDIWCQFRNENEDLFLQQNEEIISQANTFLHQVPVPITNFICRRSSGGKHDFYSEGDYWWENPSDPTGPYIRKDGQSNPNNFIEHRKAMRDLNHWVSTLVAAYVITKDKRYAIHALHHLDTFFLNKETRMNPSLLYAQAIKGKVTGRGIGIIDSIHFIETARAIGILEELNFLKGKQLLGLKDWFNQYVDWLNTHPYGIAEKNHGNNHSTWWAAQVAAFAQLTDRQDLMEVARQQFKKLLASQMSEDGRFPEELERTKPYSYTLFNLEGYSVLCQIASTQEDELWTYEINNRSLSKAWNFIAPHLIDKSAWSYAKDIQHFDELPIRSPGLLFAGLAFKNNDLLSTWKLLNPKRQSEEIIRTYPLWHSTLWKENIQI